MCNEFELDQSLFGILFLIWQFTANKTVSKCGALKKVSPVIISDLFMIYKATQSDFANLSLKIVLA